MALNMNQLTLGEVAKVEELSGMPIGEIGDETKPKGYALAALAFVAKKRQDPGFTWQAAQDLTFDEVQELLGLNSGEGSDPTPPASEQPSKPPAKKSGKTQKN